MSKRRPTEARRLQIADATLRIIAESGLGRFTTSAIAEAVGVTNGAIFRHFPSKEAIVSAAIDRAEEVLFGDEEEVGGDPIARLGEFVRRRVRVVRDNPGITRIVFSNALAQAAGADGAARVQGFKRRTVAHIEACLAEASEQGLLREGVPLEHLVLIIQGTVLGLVFLSETADSEAPGADPADAVWSSLESMIRREEDR